MKAAPAQVRQWFDGLQPPYGSVEWATRFWGFLSWEQRALGLLDAAPRVMFLAALANIEATHDPELSAARQWYFRTLGEERAKYKGAPYTAAYNTHMDRVMDKPSRELHTIIDPIEKLRQGQIVAAFQVAAGAETAPQAAGTATAG